MRRRACLLAAIAGLWLAVAGVASADGPVVGELIVHADHVLPGESFAVSGSGLDENADLGLRLTSGATTAELGSARTSVDGRLSTTLIVPATFPNGYAELEATGQGSRWTTIMLVGPRAEGPGNQPPPPDEAPIGFLLLGLTGAGLVLAFVALRRLANASR